MNKLLFQLLLLASMAILAAYCISTEYHQTSVLKAGKEAPDFEGFSNGKRSLKSQHKRKKRTMTKTRRQKTTTPAIIERLPVQLPESASICLDWAMFRNTNDYYANPSDCHTFYHCSFYNETFAIGILQKCPVGTFWNDEVHQCLPEISGIPCVDPCHDDKVAAAGCHGSPTNCAQFFVCSNGGSSPFCCPSSTRFDQATCSCIADTTCTDVCTQPGPLQPTSVAPPTSNGTHCTDSFGITMAPLPGNPNQFMVHDFSDPANPISFSMSCAPGTQFDVSACRCDIHIEVPIGPARRPCALWLPFDTDLEDHSIQKFVTFLIGTGKLDTSLSAHGLGSLFVDGGRLEIPGLKTSDFGKAASWCLFFRCESGPANNRYSCSSSSGLFSSNKNASATDFSIIMATQPTNSFTGRLRFRAPVGSQAVNAQINPSLNEGWHHVCITYDGIALHLYVNGANVDNEPSNSGSVAIAHSPYVVGTDRTFGDFTGHIDDVLVCPFTMTQEEINAHHQGNTAFLTSEGLIPA